MQNVTRRVAEFDAFAIILMNDEESIHAYELPAELNPILSQGDFQKVYFIYMLATPAA